MTITKIDTRRFKSLCQAAREDYDPTYWKSYRQQLADIVHDIYKSSWKTTDEWLACNQTVRTADDIRSEMKTAALAAGWEFGATDKQIDYIVSLAIKANDFGPIVSGGHFTKRDASNVIAAFAR